MNTQKKLEKLEKVVNDLRKSNFALENQAYAAAHDLKTPLRSIMGFSDILLEEYYNNLDKDGREYLEMISYYAKKMTSLVDATLKYSQVGKEMKFKDINLIRPIYNAVNSLDDVIKHDNIKIDIENELPTIKGDEDTLTNMFQNLISNAIKFNNSETKRIRFGIKDNWIYINDNGIGMKENYIKKIFNPMYRLEPDKYEGNGLGLAIVKRIVEKHNAKIKVESVVNGGTTFWIKF